MIFTGLISGFAWNSTRLGCSRLTHMASSWASLAPLVAHLVAFCHPEVPDSRAFVWLVDLRRGSFEETQGGVEFGAVVVETGVEALEGFRII